MNRVRFERPEIAHPLLREIRNDRRFTGADRDNDLVHQHNAHRNRAVNITAAFAFHIGNVHDDQRLIPIVLNTCALLLVQRGGQIGRVKGEARVQSVDLFLGGVLQMHPAALFQRGAFNEMIFNRLKNSAHNKNTCPF